MRSVLDICKGIIDSRKYDPLKDNKGNIRETYCNFFVRDVAKERGYPCLQGLMASEMVDFCDTSDDWVELDIDLAQSAANRGCLCIAGWASKKGHGHVVIIIPGKVIYSKSMAQDVPIIANVGGSCWYGRPLSFGFRSTMKPIRYFGLRRDLDDAIRTA
jgi:hypothetical protein